MLKVAPLEWPVGEALEWHQEVGASGRSLDFRYMSLEESPHNVVDFRSLN